MANINHNMDQDVVLHSYKDCDTLEQSYHQLLSSYWNNNN